MVCRVNNQSILKRIVQKSCKKNRFTCKKELRVDNSEKKRLATTLPRGRGSPPPLARRLQCSLVLPRTSGGMTGIRVCYEPENPDFRIPLFPPKNRVNPYIRVFMLDFTPKKRVKPEAFRTRFHQNVTIRRSSRTGSNRRKAGKEIRVRRK